MIKYVCDTCGQEISQDIAAHTFSMPRYNKTHAMCQGVILATYKNIKPMDTHLCDDCMSLIASWFDTKEESE